MLRITGDKFFTAPDLAAEIHNFVATPEGTLRTVVGPAPYNYPASDDAPEGEATWQNFWSMERPHGLFHALLRQGARDILLCAMGDSIYEWQGSRPQDGTPQRWVPLIGSASDSLYRVYNLPDDNLPRYPVQFAATDNGIVIVPQEGRAFFYDGEVVLPLGYANRPGAPVGWGPNTSGVNDVDSDAPGIEGSVNNKGYAHDAQWGYESGGEPCFGIGRVGTTASALGSVKLHGLLERGSYQAAVQWIDYFGNLSPVSLRSAPVLFNRQASYTYDADAGDSLSDLALKKIAWADVTPGPEGTVGRILYRTKDQINSGSNALYELPQHAAPGLNALCTLPDNTTDFFPDNIPDVWLLNTAEDLTTVPEFRLAAVGFNRLWIAGITTRPGMIRFSLPGRWGTFLSKDFFLPDPRAEQVTGMAFVQTGMLVFTQRSTFLLQPNADGDGFTAKTLDASVGCSAPSSIQTMPDGKTIWLAQDGFYAFDGERLILLSGDIEKKFAELNTGRFAAAVALVDNDSKEYRCWVANQASTYNDLCFVYDGKGFRTRDDAGQVYAACSTNDHRRLSLVASKLTVEMEEYEVSPSARYGVWVLDRQANKCAVTRNKAKIRTTWIGGNTPTQMKTVPSVYFWFRETGKTQFDEDGLNLSPSYSLKVLLYTNWRITLGNDLQDGSGARILDSDSSKRTYGDLFLTLVDPGDVPSLWDVTAFADAPVKLGRRRPFVYRAAFETRNISSFALELQEINSGTDIEFIGLSFDLKPAGDGGAGLQWGASAVIGENFNG
jgi:hypothetical protein